MKLSLVIPAYTINEELKELLIRCTLSYRKQVDELIVTEDGGQYVPEVHKIADIYSLNKENVSFTKNVNRGLRMATGDFIAVVNSDTQLYKGNVRDLCIPGKVTSPEIVTQNWGDGLAGPFFVIPREVLTERGLLDETMTTYSSDSEYYHRTKDILEIVRSVRIHHEIAKTTTAAGRENLETRLADEAVFLALVEKQGINLDEK